MIDDSNRPRDSWDKWDVILKPSGALLTALTVAILGFISSSYLNRRQNIETKTRLFTELISQREQSESSLRKDMFTSIIETFLRPSAKSPSLREKVLNLELLAYNFHESLNLQPLFLDLRNEIVSSKEEDRNAYLERLERIAKEITMKQKGVLEAAGAKQDVAVELKDLFGNKTPLSLDDVLLKLNNTERNFKMAFIDVDLSRREIKVRLVVKMHLENGEEETTTQEFWLGFFDFPMINNTRLSNDQRCAIVLNSFEDVLEDKIAEITLLYFPGSHASLRERPYYEELIKGLLDLNQKEKKLS
jgi:hypothetical protein